MNKNIVRILALLLAALMLTVCFVGCQDNPDQGNEGGDVTDAPADDGTQGGSDSETQAPEQSLEDILGFEIPNLDKSFNILYQKGIEATVEDIIAESFDGDEVAIEVYERNILIEEKFGVTLNFVDSIDNWNTRAEDKKFIESAVQAGTNDYDLVAGSNVTMATMMYSGLFYNLCDVESIDFDHSWWMPDTVETYGIGNRVYGLLGDAMHSYYSQLNLIAVNKTLADSFGVEAAHGDFYKLAYDGKWTLDTYLTIGAAYGQDNGDGVMKATDDVFGSVVINVPSRNFLYSLGHEIITLNETEDGVVLPTALDEKTVTSYEKLYNAFPQTVGTGVSPNCISISTVETACKAFSENRILMMTSYFSYLGSEDIRNMNGEYMMMPMPKYDENQEDYITPFGTTASMLLIPLTAINEEQSGMVMEYMGYVGEKDIVPVYIGQTLKLKYANDDKVMEMVQYIIDRAAFTLTQATIWNCEVGGMFRNMYCFGSMNAVGSPNVSSFYGSYRRAWQKQLDNIISGIL